MAASPPSRGRSEKAVRQMTAKWARFFDWLAAERGYPEAGRDMARVTTDDLVGYKDHLFAAMTAGDTEIRKPKTVEDHLRALSGLLATAFQDRKIAANPAAGFKVPKAKTDERDKYRDFDRDEVRLILAMARKAPPEIRWPIWLAAYSGGRLAEIVEAQTADIEITDDGTAVFHIRLMNRPPAQRLKTSFSARPVPVHAAVIAEGFVKYVENVRAGHAGEGPLFPQFRLWRGRPNTDASARLMKWLRDEAGIVHPRKTFHSWRHTAKTQFREFVEKEEYSDKLTGHAGGGIGREYGKYPIPLLKRQIDRVPDWLADHCGVRRPPC